MRPGLPLCVLILFSAIARGQLTPPPAGLQGSGTSIQVVEGDGAINSRQQRGHDLLVRVVGRDGEPVSGAMVTFLAPSTGPSAAFGESGLSLSVQTDARGMAAARGLRANGIPGQYRIRVTTTWQGSAAVATILQTNAYAATRSGRGKKVAILVGIAAAAIGGVAVAAGKSGSSSDAGGATGGTPTAGAIISGIPVIGPPR